MNVMEVLKVEELVRNYGQTEVLKRLSFSVTQGEFIGIMGKSGCGKTTLLKIIGLIDRPTNGRIFLMGEDTSQMGGKSQSGFKTRAAGICFSGFLSYGQLISGRKYHAS